MLKKCFFANCTQDVTTFCNCKGNPIYCCMVHLGNHCSSGGNHSIVSASVGMLLSKTKEIFQLLEKNKKETITHTEKLLNCLVEASNKALRSIRETKKSVEKFLIENLNANTINPEVFEKITKLSTPKNGSILTDNLKMTKEFSELCEIKTIEAPEENKNQFTVCNKGHQLIPHRSLNNRCDCCGEIMVNTFMRCTPCNFDMCMSCEMSITFSAPLAKHAKCNNGHSLVWDPLRLLNSAIKHNTTIEAVEITCDVCRLSTKSGSFACITCRYDVCTKCIQKRIQR